MVVDREMERVIGKISDAISDGSPRARLEGAALAFLTYVKDNPDGFAVLSRDAPANVGMASLLAEVGQRVGDVFADQFKRAGYDTKFAPIYAQSLIGMVTFVGQWWTEERSVSVEEAASHIAALAWMGLRNLPKKPGSQARARRPSREASSESQSRLGRSSSVDFTSPEIHGRHRGRRETMSSQEGTPAPPDAGRPSSAVGADRVASPPELGRATGRMAARHSRLDRQSTRPRPTRPITRSSQRRVSFHEICSCLARRK